MVFFALQDNIPVNAQDIYGKIKIKFLCCDNKCNSYLSFIESHHRTINIKDKNGQIITKNVDVSSHFKHNKDLDSTKICSVENFINLLGNSQAREFYKYWTNFFIFESIKNTFNSESKFHILFKNIMIQTSSKELSVKQIKDKEHYAQNNEKITWILQVNDSVRQKIIPLIIKRKYYTKNSFFTEKYYINSETNYYHDFELFDYNKSNIYIDIGLSKLFKLVKKTFQGFEVEPIKISEFLNLFSEIINPNINIPKYEKIKITTYNIYNEILEIQKVKYDKMEKELDRFKKDNIEKLKHTKSREYHNKYISVKSHYNIDYCENIQNKIYENKLINDYSIDCLQFIWKIYDENEIPINCSTCNKIYTTKIENKQDHKYCDACINKYDYLLIKNNDPLFESTDKSFDEIQKIWASQNDNICNFIRKIKNNNYCNECIKNNFKNKQDYKYCVTCINKYNYNNLKCNDPLFESTDKSFDEIQTIWASQNDNICNFIRKIKNNNYCNECIKNNFKIKNSKDHKYCDACIKYNCNECIKNNFEYCMTCSINMNYKLIYTKIKTDRRNSNKILKNINFDELVKIWKVNNDDFYCYIKNKYCIDMCKICLKQKFYNNKYDIKDCIKCNT